LLTKYRFHRVTPESRHNAQRVCPVSKLGKCIA
jgi:hypothetical protein